MLFPQEFPTLTIPTGAGPGQQRITINDGQNGKIQVYDSSGRLVDSLGGAQGQFILYDSSGSMVISLASTSGTDSKTGAAFQAGITTYSTSSSINLFGNYLTLSASNGTQLQLASGVDAAFFLTPTGGPWRQGQVNTNIGGGNHPLVSVQSPSDITNGFSSSIDFEGSSTTDSSTSILGLATHFDMNALCTFGNIAVGRVTITPSAANTPTSATVTYSQLTGTSFNGFCTAFTSVPGTSVTGVSMNNVTSTSANVWLTRTNTTATIVWWMVWGT